MKKILLTTALYGLSLLLAQSQQANPPPPGGSYNPYLIQGFVSPAPMLPAEFNGTGTLTFDVGNTGSSDIVWVTGQEMLVTLSLSYGVPNVANPNDPVQAITAVTGPGAAWFNWEYFPAQKTFRGTQKATIPGGARQTINIAYKVVQNSFQTESYKNGFNTNISPPGYTNPQPTDDDTVAAYTYVQAFDYGDAPAAYAAVSHEVSLVRGPISNLYLAYMALGTVVDPEAANQSSSGATADDTNQTGGLALDDEDGVVFPVMTPGATVNVPVTVTLWDWDPASPTATATVRGWIDWNNDNVYTNTATPGGERIFSLDVSGYLDDLGETAWTGPRTFTIPFPVTVPANATGTYNARFRFGPSVTPTLGLAAHGEVEDYQFQAGAQTGTITGKLYIDTNGDGNQDVGEPNLPNVDVLITDANNNTQTVTTDSNGNWTATVPPGTATVDIVNSDPQYPTGYTQTEGTDPSTVVAVSATSVNAGNDGFYLPGRLTGHLYFDSNGDGNQDAGEPNLPNIDVIITDSNGNTQTVSTDANGDWTASVPPGSTSIDVNNSDPQFPAGGVQTEGTDPTVVTAVAGVSTNGGIDGFYIPGILTGHLYIDTNGDGNQDVGEPNLPNINVIITDSNGNLQTVITDSNGDWTANVPAGSTSINVDNSDPDFPPGAVQTEGTDPTVVTAVTDTTVNGGVDGFFLPGSISGITQVDTNGDDIGDLTINDVTYRLLNYVGGTPVDNPNIAGNQPYVIVSTNGSYNFTNLPPGQYTVVQDQPAGFISQRDWDSTSDTAGSPADPTNTSPTDNQIPVDLASGESDTGNNFVEFRCPTRFTAWELIHPTAGGTGDNPDGDIFRNLVEYAFCMPPNSGDNTPYCIVPSITQAGNYDLVFNRVLGGKDDTGFFLRYTDVLSTHPNSWIEVDIDSMVNVTVTTNPGGFSEQVRIANIKSLLPGGSERGFYQIALKLDYNLDSTVDVVDYTYVEGWQTVTIEANECETYSTPFLPCPQFTGVVTSVSGLTLNLSGSAPGVDFTPGNGELQAAPALYRIEVMSGPLNGHRFDVLTGGVASLTLESETNVFTGPPFGSLDTAAAAATLASQLTGAQIMLVKYLTVDELVPVASVNATGSATTADRVLYNDGVSGWRTYWAYSNGGVPHWALIGSGFTDRKTDVVAPHQGFFIHPKAQAETISSYGMVRQSNFAQPISTSYPMFGSPYPMHLSPTQMAYLPANFTGSRDPAVSDQVLHWTSDEVLPADKDGYSAYWLNKVGTRQQWTALLDTTLANQNSTDFIRAGRAYWFSTTAAKPGHVVPVPWTLPARIDNGVAP
jgi:hypothetical protein